MKSKNGLLPIVLFACVAAVASAQSPRDDPTTPRFTELVIVRGLLRADFDARVLDYFDLRTTLEDGLPAQQVTANPADNIEIQRTLARRIRRARVGALRGAIFTPAISVEFRRILLIETTPETRSTIMDDNPGRFSHRINGDYPKRRPLSTMPGTFLAVLPVLPDGLEYRFLGPHLILHDTRANVILDAMSCAIACIDGER
ncbi:MAG: hypothetical protein ABW318_25430 [Vicinamibacterales bacterium]